MEIKTFRAKTMQQALNLVRQEMGTEATVLHTREINSGLIRRILRGREYEIAASREYQTPTQVAQPVAVQAYAPEVESLAENIDYGSKFREDLLSQSEEQQELNALAEQLEERTRQVPKRHLPEALFRVYTDMIESDIDQSIAQAYLDELRADSRIDLEDQFALQGELQAILDREFSVTGPINVQPGQNRVVALVGPTGVGKTTTIAKLAANYRLRENKRVGLITVDTYRIAAVEQLRTYADIIDLPMEVVSTPREMREAVSRMRDLELVLMDTAGRSPRDEVKIQELKSMLNEAKPDEVHLVLSTVAGSRSLISAAKKFSSVGTTAILLTKLDEATCTGNLVSLSRESALPISYLTDGQNVPDDIQVAERESLARMILSPT